MLAQLDDDPAIERAYVAGDGSRLLIEAARTAEGAPDREALLAIVSRVLATADLRADAEPDAAAALAWADRHQADRWLGRADAWRLSWREAEQFADRFLAWLAANGGGPPAASQPLRPVLVELFFGEVEPGLAPGPAPTLWTRDADRAARVAVVIERASAHLDPGALAVLDVLRDAERVHTIIQPAP